MVGLDTMHTFRLPYLGATYSGSFLYTGNQLGGETHHVSNHSGANPPFSKATGGKPTTQENNQFKNPARGLVAKKKAQKKNGGGTGSKASIRTHAVRKPRATK